MSTPTSACISSRSGLARRDPRPGAFRPQLAAGRRDGRRPHAAGQRPDPEGPAPAAHDGITHAGEIGIDAQLARLDAALAGGLRLVQIREPALPDAARSASPAPSSSAATPPAHW
jgi:beta-phosphoglucomutase-like phosphatase (HAD superfamily)